MTDCTGYRRKKRRSREDFRAVKFARCPQVQGKKSKELKGVGGKFGLRLFDLTSVVLNSGWGDEQRFSLKG